MPTFTLPFSSPDATLARAGGKGANLAELSRAGFGEWVPPGFLVTTEAYRTFVAANQIQSRILALANTVTPDDPRALEAASTEIRALFEQGQLPQEIAADIVTAYRALSHTPTPPPDLAPVAVRSSATAEDLPGLSFAGQQDTYLNIIGEEAVREAVKKCWGSLWTARALGYRARNHIPPDDVALAVVVQKLIPSDSSGVIFTANPLTGRRDEIVMDASFGLGEAIVSGQVEPDRYVVNRNTWQITERALGAKALTILPRSGGGVEQVARDGAGQQTLSDPQIVELAKLAARVADHYGSPQDIEWAQADGRFHLLQSRPITSLYPLPKGLAADPLHVMFSFGAVQGMLDPMTPLGQDAIRFAVSGVGGLLGYQLNYDTQGVFRLAGERLWIDVTPVIRNGLGRRAARGALRLVEPSVGQALETLVADPRLAPTGDGFRPSTIVHLAPRLFPIWIRIVRYLIDPDSRRVGAIRETEQYLAQVQARCAVEGDRQTKLARRVALLRELSHAFPKAIPTLITGLVAGMASFNIFTQLLKHLPPEGIGGDPARLVLEATRGLPHNVTTEMDLSLWETARAIRSDPAGRPHFQAATAAQLAADYSSGHLPAPTQNAVAKFLERYGMRGIAEIDLGRPRWREDPTPLMQVLQSYLRIEDESQAPDAVFKRGEGVGLEALARAESAATRNGWLKAKLVHFFGHRMRSLMGLRESPKFFIIRMMGFLRAGLLDSGREFVEAGLLTQPDDLVFLRLPELEEFAQGVSRDWKVLIAERRAVYQREKLRKQVPRLLLSDGRAIYEGLTDSTAPAGEDVLVGSAVSPGVVEGVVQVVFDPHSAQLAPGEILVCPGTDPAWTPLFLAAGGLVMEVGGMMTHGSVVAREYGIPAVVGVHEATTRLKTGQRVRVDGNTGRVSILQL